MVNMKYTDSHKPYYNSRGEEIPSATTILKILNKPSLIHWANYLGFKHIDVEDELNRTSAIGTAVHEVINWILSKYYIILIDDDFINRRKLYPYLNNFFEWYNHHSIEPIILEKEFISDNYNYGGTLDFYGKVDNLYTIVDFKTSKQIRLSMFIQLALYCILLESYGYTVEQVGIVLVNDKNGGHKFITREELQIYIDFAYKLVDIYHLYYELNDKCKWNDFIK